MMELEPIFGSGFIPDGRDRDISVLCLYDLAAGKPEMLARFPQLIEAPQFTPGGDALYFNSLALIWRYSLSDGSVRRIDTGACQNCNNDHVLSPDGSQLGISCGDENGLSRIYVLPAAGGEPRLVTGQGPSYLHGWSPDGKTLTYCAFRGPKPEGGNFFSAPFTGPDIYTIPVSGGEERQLTRDTGYNDGSEYGPDGTIWFQSTRTGLMQAWKMDPDGGNQTQVTFDGNLNTWFPHISPDGEKVAAISYHKGDLQPWEHLPHKNVLLRLFRPDGSGIRTAVELFGGQGTLNVNSWSPDSRYFAYVQYELPEG